MSLQVWLPLKGNLENLGLAGDIPFTIDPTWADFGKISQESYACKLGTGWVKVDALDGVTNYSVAFWIYIDSAEEYSNWYDFYGIRSVNNDGTIAVGRTELRNQELPGKLVMYVAKDRAFGSNTYDYYNVTDNIDIASDKWAHMALVKSDDDVKVYVNGDLYNTVECSKFESYPLPLNGYFSLGQTGLNSGYIQDFRIYDHCLSAKEAKLISQALVCHYPLNDQFIEATTNLRTWQLPSSGTWDEIWGGSTTVWSIYDTTYEPVPFDRCYKGEITYSGSSGGASRYIQTLDISPSTTYTYSAYIKASDDLAYTHANFLYRYEYPGDASNTGTRLYEGGIFNKARMQPYGNGWYRCWGTFTTLADTNSMRIAFFTYPNKNATYYVGGWMLEQKDHMTPYVFGSRDSDGTVYDCSGYGNDGAIAPSGVYVDDESARYSSCVRLDKGSATSGYIDAGTGGKVTDEITVSTWLHMDTWTANQHPFSCTEGGGWNIENQSSMPSFPVNVSTVGYKHTVNSSVTPKWTDLSSGWHLFTGTYDGYTVTLYIDGQPAGSNTTGSTSKLPIRYHASNHIYLHSEATGSGPSGSYDACKMSDFRIYATALSASDVKELYETSASVDNHGNMYAYEFNEL